MQFSFDQQVHVLPREIFGKPTFAIAAFLMKRLPLWMVDKLLLFLALLVLGNIERYGLRRPSMGPIQLKNAKGKTPVLDIGALQKIKSGGIKVVPGIKRFSHGRVDLVDRNHLHIDSVILATGYCSNVPSWLQVRPCSNSSLLLLRKGIFSIQINEELYSFYSYWSWVLLKAMKYTNGLICFCPLSCFCLIFIHLVPMT